MIVSDSPAIRPAPVSRSWVARSVPEAASTAQAREAGPQ